MGSSKVHREAPKHASPEKSRGRTKPDLIAEVLVRGTRALTRILPNLPPTTLATLAEAPVDERLLVSVAMQPEVMDRLVPENPLLKARLRGLDAQRQLLEAEGGTLSADDVGGLLSIKRQAVDKARREGRLLALPVARRWRYPAWQFVDHSILQGLRDTLSVLHPAGPWAKSAFFLSRSVRLGERRPLDLLLEGRVADVLRAARDYGQHGAA